MFSVSLASPHFAPLPFQSPVGCKPDVVPLANIVGDLLDDASGAFLTSISTSFGFTMTALIHAVHSNLSLYQALQATYIVHMANISVTIALTAYPRIKLNHDTLVRFAATFQVHLLGQLYG